MNLIKFYCMYKTTTKVRLHAAGRYFTVFFTSNVCARNVADVQSNSIPVGLCATIYVVCSDMQYRWQH